MVTSHYITLISGQCIASLRPTNTIWLSIPTTDMVYSPYLKQRVLYFLSKGYMAPSISQLLKQEGLKASRQGVLKFIHRYLRREGHPLSLRTMLRCWTALGWTFRGSTYCQLIRAANKAKQLQWAKDHQHENFMDVVWTDECTVQLETHRRFSCRKKGEPPHNKPRYVWKGE